jgi:hypothetical protein
MVPGHVQGLCRVPPDHPEGGAERLDGGGVFVPQRVKAGGGQWLLLTPDALHLAHPGVGIEFGHGEKFVAGLFDRCGLTSKMQLGDSQGLG